MRQNLTKLWHERLSEDFAMTVSEPGGEVRSDW